MMKMGMEIGSHGHSHKVLSLMKKKDQFKVTLVKKGSTIGANSTIICGLEIGEYSLIGAGSLVTKNVKKYSLNYGNPAIQKGWVSKTGDKLNLPLSGNGQAKCIKSNNLYILKDNEINEY